MLHPGYLVTRGTVVFRNLGFNDNLRIELVGNNEIWGLIETRDALRTLGLSITHPVPVQGFLDRGFEYITNEFAD